MNSLDVFRTVWSVFFCFAFLWVTSIHPDPSRSSRIAAAERVEEFSSLDLSRCAWAAAMLEALG